ncbi:adenylate/guanylate cyclase domain-containing protein [Acuticoccus sp. MNP-M23]|uniref:adenylate/guanylate cyclase domain-containing protein n=1 Tax=Acuticoccus sp. MNP-M23 TaxID=3072793 RepID=UPI0028169722|nr:adenylate/guanylate cyclase domain-containing protein [Acuticoccus sp. MNP-M23]WMS40790.1 adenylate/guanylate cyclase domain-containing protein [Acuticoccus sp. MNP-M23]
MSLYRGVCPRAMGCSVLGQGDRDDRAVNVARRRRWLMQWRPKNALRLLGRSLGSFSTAAALDEHAAFRVARAEQRGLQLAIICRTIAFALAGAYYVASLLLSDFSPTIKGVGLIAALTLVGVVHFAMIGTRWDTVWLKYVMSAFDILAICALVVVLPLGVDGDVPQSYIYISVTAHVLMPFIALAALSLSPSLVLFAGAVAAAGWWGAFMLVTWGIENPLSWANLPANPTAAEYEALVFSPDFIGRGTRLIEILSLIIVSAVLSLTVVRARRIFVAQVHAQDQREEEREARARIFQQLGRFVPASVADRLIDDPSALEPNLRDGAVLVMDIRDFTAYAESRGPADVIADLNRFFAVCADEVSERDGVIISFTGDGLLATFNTPIRTGAPEKAALLTAQALVECGKDFGFFLRIGIAAGSIAAGSVGSTQRQAFTVYGDTVNRAARLEALAKELDVQILVDQTVADVMPDAMVSRGDQTIRGFTGNVPVWEVVFAGEVQPAAGQSEKRPR